MKMCDMLLKWMGDVEDFNDEALDRIGAELDLDKLDVELVRNLVAYILKSWTKNIRHGNRPDMVALERLMEDNRQDVIGAIQAVVELMKALGKGEKRPDRWKDVVH